MTRLHARSLLFLLALIVLAGCATRPVNPPVTQTSPRSGYRFEARQGHIKDKDNLVILAFSGGGTRAAAFSYGVLEFLKRTEIVGPRGNKRRLLDEVDIITGVSGGSFTALAYGLYGDKLFNDYEQRFLKRNVQGEIIARTFSPRYWGNLWSEGWGRSELASQLYDEILSMARRTPTSTAVTARSSWHRPPTSRPAPGLSSTRTRSTCCART